MNISIESRGKILDSSFFSKTKNDLKILVTNSTEELDQMSIYSSELTTNSSRYDRRINSTLNYFYESIELNVNTTGNYRFVSQSYIDTYGYIYQGNFNPSYPSMNILEEDDQNGGNNQFRIIVNLRSESKYILVFTTYIEDITGPFSIVSYGPDQVQFIPINSETNQ